MNGRLNTINFTFKETEIRNFARRTSDKLVNFQTNILLPKKTEKKKETECLYCLRSEFAGFFSVLRNTFVILKKTLEFEIVVYK